MNINTGEIKNFGIDDIMHEEFKPVDLNFMTSKQKEEMQVSKHDNKSKLGIMFTGCRKERRKQEREYKKKMDMK